MRRRTAKLVRAFGALGAVAALLVGWPAALALAVGWPLPTEIPGLQELVNAARTGITDRTVLEIVAVLGWLAWAQIAVAFSLEVVAVARRRAARPSVFMLPGVQHFVGRLVAALIAIGSLVPAAPSAAEPRLHLSALAASSAPETPTTAPEQPPTIATPPETRADEPPGAGQEAPTLAYRVERHDSYWDIAERFLGDGREWGRVRDLNVGRVMGDGTAVTPASEIVHPGWIVYLPADADPSAPGAIPIDTLEAEAEGTASIPERAVVEPGDHLWKLAEETLTTAWSRPPNDAEITPYWHRLIETNRERLHDPDNPDLVFTGQEFLLPAAPPVPGTLSGVTPETSEEAEAPDTPQSGEGDHGGKTGETPQPGEAPDMRSSPATREQSGRADTSSGDAQPEPPRDDPRTPSDQRDADDGTSAMPAGVLGVAAAGIAVGIGQAVRRRRVRRAQRLPSGARPDEPAAELDHLRAELARTSDHDHVDRLSAVMGVLAGDLAIAKRTESRPRVVQVSPERIEALLSEPALPTTDVWRPEASGTVWVHDGQEVPDVPHGSCVPTLVTLGCPEPSGQLYLDLEAESLLAVVGDKEQALNWTRSVVMELAHSVYAETLAITVVGDLETPELADLDRVAVCDTWEEVGDDLLAWAGQSHDLLTANRWPNTFLARAHAPDHDGLAPHVVVCVGRPQDESFETLCETVASHTTSLTVIVVGDDLPGATRIEIADDELLVPSLGLTCRAQMVDDDLTTQVVELLHDAERMPDQLAVLREPQGAGDSDRVPEDAQPLGNDAPYEDPSHDVLVRVLGDIEVVGGKRPLSPKQTALVAYLALNGPVTAERLEEAVWNAPTKRLANTASECRAALGAQHVPVAKEGRYRVGPTVRTDTDLFERRVAYAETQSDEHAIDTLKGALKLVRGPVFSYRSADRASYVWVDVENWMSTWEYKVTEAAMRLANLCLEGGRAEDAVWAAGQGLLASPLHSGLTEALMRAHDARGDRQAAEAVYQSHVKALEQLEIDEVAESTLELRESMRRRSGDAPGESSAATG